MTTTDFVLTLLGGFYIFAGVMLCRASLTSHLIDRVLEALDGGAPAWVERARTWFTVLLAIPIFAGGTLLMFRSELAVWPFITASLLQAVFYGWIAPRYLDFLDPPDPRGRQQSMNAFVLYAAATAYVVWAYYIGALLAWHDTSLPIRFIAIVSIGGFAAYLVWKHLGTRRLGEKT